MFKIPKEKGVSDVEFLVQEFKKKFSYDSNVQVTITFQRFEDEWGERVELEKDEVVNNKDKLTAVVTPILVTPQREIVSHA